MLKYYKLKKQDAYINKKLVENQQVVVSVGYDTKTDTTLPGGYFEYPKENGAYIEQDIMNCVLIDNEFVAQEYPEEPIKPQKSIEELLEDFEMNILEAIVGIGEDLENTEVE